MFELFPKEALLWAAGFAGVVLIIFLWEYRRLRLRLLAREEQMNHRMYELSILRELGQRIGYSLNVRKIVDVISGSLGKLLPYSTVSYMLPDEEGRLLFNITLAEPVNRIFITDVKQRMQKSINALFGRDYTDKDIDETVSGTLTDQTSKKKVESFFNVPIVINDRPAGILTVASVKQGLYRTSEEVEILYTIMNQASDAVSKLETVLEIEKGKLNAMVASMADGVMMVDVQNRLQVINPQTLIMLGLKLREPTIFDVLDAMASHLDLRTKIEESIKDDQLIIENNLQINGRFVQILITPVKDNKNRPLGSVVLFHDTTHEKELEKMREDFTSMMVHELRSPLTGIRSIASLLKNDKVKNEALKYQQFVDLIVSNSSSMLDLVNDLLDVAKLESGKFQILKRPMDLRHIIEVRLESFNSLALEGKITLEPQIAADFPPLVNLDENKIAEVLNNLLSNAIKFTPAGGKITIAAFPVGKGEDLTVLATNRGFTWPGVHSGAVCPVPSVAVAVTDTGLGIAQTEIPKLFNKFQQLSTASKSEKKGTGLGLVVVKGIIDAHGGSLGVFSDEGKGSAFYFTLPLEEVAAPAVLPSAQNVSLKS